MLLRVQSCKKTASRDLTARGGAPGHEMTVEIQLNVSAPTLPKAWTMLVRTYRAGGRLFIVRGFTETRRFGEPEKVGEELGKVLDTFKLTGS